MITVISDIPAYAFLSALSELVFSTDRESAVVIFSQGGDDIFNERLYPDSSGTIPIYTENVHYLDLSKYQSEGFKVYVSEFVSFDYVNVGIVDVTVYDGVVRADGKPIESTYKEGTKEYEDLIRTSRMKYATMDDAFLVLINQCKERGANGVIGVKTELMRAKEYSDKAPLGTVIGYRISGIAIKK